MSQTEMWWVPGPLETRLIVNGYDLTKFVTGYQWSGAKSDAARRLDFSPIHSDKMYIPEPEINEHDMVQFYVEHEEVFRGYIVGLDRRKSDVVTSMTSLDGGYFLNNNEVHMQANGETADELTRKACEEVGVPVGKLEPGVAINRVFDGVSIYALIMTAYTITSQSNGEQYAIMMDKGKLNTIKKGDKVFKFLLDGDRDVFDSSLHKSSEDAVNRVKIFDDNGTEAGEVSLPNAEDFPGILQKVYKGEMGEAEAKKLLQDVTLEASIESFGYIDCITHRAVVLREPVTGLDGLFYIDGDRHSWAGGIYTMSLDLAFENVMDSQMAGSDPSESQSGGYGRAPGNSNKARAYNFLREKGFSSAAAIGIIANLVIESGVDPTRKQDGGGPGRGIAQWEVGGRWDILQSWAGKQGKDPLALETQLELLVYELEGGDSTTLSILNRDYGGIEGFKNANNHRWATRAFCMAFERPSIPHLERRYQEAEKMWAEWKDLDKIDLSIQGDGRGTGLHSWPVPGHSRISSPYGYRSNPFSGKSEFHGGIDIPAPTGTAVIATDGGTVILAGSGDDWTYGKSVVISHGGTSTRYAHLSVVGVSVGQKVSKGQKIGEVGSTGASTGPHLHFEVRSGDGLWGQTQNPRSYV